MSALHRWSALAVLCLPVLLISIDMTVLGIAVPALSASLRPSSAQLLWIVDLYSFLVAGLLVLMGSLGDRIGRRRLLLIGALAFGVASILAAFAPTAAALIAARALLGLGGATLMPSTLGLLRTIFTDRGERRTAVAIWAAGFSAGAVLGPILGGLLLEHYWWGSVFLINVPVMVVFVIAGRALLPEARDPAPGPFDLISALLSIAGLLAVVYALKEGAHHLSSSVLVIAVVGVILLWLFVRRQQRLAQPMLDLRLLSCHLDHRGRGFCADGCHLLPASVSPAGPGNEPGPGRALVDATGRSHSGGVVGLAICGAVGSSPGSRGLRHGSDEPGSCSGHPTSRGLFDRDLRSGFGPRRAGGWFR